MQTGPMFLSCSPSGLSDSQAYWIDLISRQLRLPCTYEADPNSDLVSEDVLHLIGDCLRIHHCLSDQSLTKDKFEHVTRIAMNRCQHTATKPPKNYPLYDLDIDGTRYSLKTQADDRLSWRKVWISKMMELNTGKWDSDDSDLIALLDQYMTHIAGCDRILMLRTLQKAPEPWHYELVEIPKDLLLEAKDGTLEMMHNSKQMPKPGYCRVKDSIGKTKFELYFDGGGERKLQVKNLDRELCITHANWIFSDTFALEQSVGG